MFSRPGWIPIKTKPLKTRLLRLHRNPLKPGNARLRNIQSNKLRLLETNKLLWYMRRMNIATHVP
jgi:hypothetical protein